jgi:hypothetical protein
MSQIASAKVEAGQAALGRASSLATALSPTAGGHPTVEFAALMTPPPEPMESGAAAALFLVAWPTTVTVGVWMTTLPYPQSNQQWEYITGTGEALHRTPQGASAGTAELTIATPPSVLSWTSQPTAVPGWFHQAGYSPGTLPSGSAGAQALLDRLGIPPGNQATPLFVTRPPSVRPGRPAGGDSRVFIIATNPGQPQ